MMATTKRSVRPTVSRGSSTAPTKMKLAEALILRADSVKRIEHLKTRIGRNAKVQEGDRPAEDPSKLLVELEQLATQLVSLIQRINKTNSETQLGSESLTAALARRDGLRLTFGIYKSIAEAASVTQVRLTKSEVRFKSTINVAAIQRKADDCAREHRELDARIQEMNWQTELKK